jgi:hypothetical protein
MSATHGQTKLALTKVIGPRGKVDEPTVPVVVVFSLPNLGIGNSN